MRVQQISAVILFGMLSSSAWAVVGQGYDFKNKFIVVFDNNVSDKQWKEVESFVVQNNGQVKRQYRHALKGLAITLPPQAKASLQRFSSIKYIENDRLVMALPRGGKPNKGGDDNSTPPTPQEVPWGITRIGGPSEESSFPTAWVIDSGIDSRHADLNVDRSRGVNFARGKNTTEDGNGHGTHVAGTIAAIDNDIDVVGVAPGAAVVPVRVLDNSGSGSMSGVVAGVDYVAANASAGDCANMSLGGSGYSRALDEALIAAVNATGIVFAVAAGNSGADIIGYTPAVTQYPGVYTISAFAEGDTVASFSNYSNNNVYTRSDGANVAAEMEYAMPGVNVLSTQSGGGVVAYNGTSMAAPHFCGLVLAVGVDGINASDVIVDSRDAFDDPVATK
ncbi:S8 family serine peptidase [Vibrio mediterranei]|uniref:S8 family serine peptidase n=1 Tax=Vibrio mediterranei TaxID=689 RepID=UPI001EFE8EDE|nr:S8 family serine peptidase [Vibrio mediterranei]MCG9623312.1 S8 family serine peptidase [Vibrio mediterranei]